MSDVLPISLSVQLERYIDSLGLRYFKGKELTPYWSRSQAGVTNAVPPESLWGNIVATLRVLDALRAKLGAPIIITSSYRSPNYNRVVGGEVGSLHMQFKAIDFQGRAGTPREWARMLREMRAGGAFRGGIGTYATFVHVDTRGSNADW